MKNLTILLLLFAVFAFGEWDVDPDYSTLTADTINAEKANIEKLVVDNNTTFKDTIDLRDARLSDIKFFRNDTTQALVTFIFDDGNATDSTIMKPMFNAQGEVACCAIITNDVGSGGILTWAQIIAMESSGWEILSHTHTSPVLTSITLDSVRIELSYSKQLLEAQGLTINNFVYPGGTHNANIRKLVKEYYRSGRSIQGKPQQDYNITPLYTYGLQARVADDHTELAKFQAWVDTAIIKNEWLIFYLHTTTSDDSTAISTLIDYIQTNSVPIVTVNQALGMVGNFIETGDEYAIGNNGVMRTNYSTKLFANRSALTWGGGSLVNSTADQYYQSTAVNDTLLGYAFSLPINFVGDSIQVDSLILFVKTTGNEDSVRVVLEHTAYSSYVGIDSICNVGGGTSGNQRVNILQNGSFFVSQGNSYRIVVRCQNNGAWDINIGTSVKVVWSIP